jgi:zinc/manganese transport system substrate-binding protein
MRTSALWLISAALLVSACGRGTPPAASDGGLRVLAAETFLADIAENVAGDRLAVRSLLPTGVDPHGYQLTPQDAIALAESDVLIVNGQGYEAWLIGSYESGGRGKLQIEASAGLASGPDPHLWMYPLNVVLYAENIRDGLSKADPQGSSTYAANAEAYRKELQDLDVWIRGEVEKIAADRRLLATNHQALQAFAEAYGFSVVGAAIPSFTSEAEPSAQEMAALIRTIKLSGAPAVFLGIGENDDLARQIAAESGAQVVTGLYVEMLSDANGPAPTYIDMMKYDVLLIAAALR